LHESAASRGGAGVQTTASLISAEHSRRLSVEADRVLELGCASGEGVRAC
jgi:hypothetical protein